MFILNNSAKIRHPPGGAPSRQTVRLNAGIVRPGTNISAAVV
jgi:hypothetical protein